MKFLQNLYLLKSLKLVKEKPKLFGLMILFDILFVVGGILFRKLTELFARSLVIPQNVTGLLTVTLLSIMYYLAMLFVYTFIKYHILHYVEAYFQKMRFTYDRLGKFFILNLILGGIFFMEMIVLFFFLQSTKAEFRPFLLIIFMVPLIIFSYLLLEISHSLFILENRRPISTAIKTVFTRIKIYKETFLSILIPGIILTILFVITGFFIRLNAPKDYFAYYAAYTKFQQVIGIIILIVLYFIIVLNQIIFYMYSKENVLPRH